MNLIDIHETFKTDEQCMDYLAGLRWPEGVRCVVCGSKEVKQYASPTKKQPSRKIYQCQEQTCKQQFTATSGTIFHDTHLPLTKWFMALSVIVDAKKGVSAKQLQRHLNVGYKTAWYLAHRIRKAMEETGNPLLTGTVEIDETYIGGRKRGVPKADAFKAKRIVMGAVQRGGPLRMTHVKGATVGTFREFINANVSAETEHVMTDQHKAYPAALGSLSSRHETVNHIVREYVRGNVHTNTIESAFSLLKRGIIGTYHQLSIKHLQAYLDEFSYRFNRREIPNRFEETLRRMTETKPMPLADLTAEKA